MPTLYTIGCTQRTLESFVRGLQSAGVDAVIDIRLRNTSQLAGWSKGPDLSFVLREGFGIAYEHRPELAPTAAILDGYRAKRDWPAYESAILALFEQRGADSITAGLLDCYGQPCLLCSEPTATHCHRRLLAEWCQARMPNLLVVHL